MIEKQELSVLESKNQTILTLRGQREHVYLLVEDILYVEGLGNYTIFYLSNKKSYVSTKLLKHYQVLLKDLDFIRISKSYLVNRLHAKKYDVLENCLIITGNISLAVSVRKRKLLEFL